MKNNPACAKRMGGIFFVKGEEVVKKEKERPGIIVYYDDFRWIEKFMTDEQLGVFFRTIINYGEYGECVSDSADTTLQMAFWALKDKIDRDGVSYQNTIKQKQYAGYCSKERKHGREPLEYEDWLDEKFSTTVNDRTRTLNAVQRNQLTGNVNVNIKGNALGKGEVEGFKGDGEGKPTFTVANQSKDDKGGFPYPPYQDDLPFA